MQVFKLNNNMQSYLQLASPSYSWYRFTPLVVFLLIISFEIERYVHHLWSLYFLQVGHTQYYSVQNFPDLLQCWNSQWWMKWLPFVGKKRRSKQKPYPRDVGGLPNSGTITQQWSGSKRPIWNLVNIVLYQSQNSSKTRRGGDTSQSSRTVASLLLPIPRLGGVLCR